MAWPDSPPPAQLALYEGGLSGATCFVYLRDGSTTADEPVEYFDNVRGTYTLKAGYYFSPELAAYLAGSGGGGEPEPPVVTADPLALSVAAFLGQSDNPELIALAGQHATIVSQMARAYTRDGGFFGSYPREDVEAVIVTATARLLANPEQLDHSVGRVSFRGAFVGWSLAELFVLNRYRKRAL